MKFKRLLSLINHVKIINPPGNNLELKNISKDSREIKPGFLFCAIGSDILDGHAFINDAIKRGATTVLAERQTPLHRDDIPIVLVQDCATTFASLSCYFYGFPARSLNITGITGTNGKTTITYILEAIFKEAGLNTGVIGTVNYRYNNRSLPADNTTPHANHYQKLLRDMNRAGVTHIISEISSHGLALKRIWKLDINTAIFTNLTQDHLDFHTNFEDYYQAKKSLFSEILLHSSKKNRLAIINYDDPYGRRLINELNCFSPGFFKLGGFSTSDRNADFFAKDLHSSLDGSTFTVVCQGSEISIETPLIGIHNVSNLLGAVAVAKCYGIKESEIVASIKKLKTVPGRLTRITDRKGRHIFVDYAHTPDALKNVLSALNMIGGGGRIIVVFGCGGDRDQSKRPLMGKVAISHASDVIVTSDNPRSENPEDIIRDVLSGIGKKTKNVIVEQNRKPAIEKSIDISNPGDIILIAGKGHEDYQILGTDKIHFDDREIVERYLNEAK